jgi:hypothetical protein
MKKYMYEIETNKEKLYIPANIYLLENLFKHLLSKGFELKSFRKKKYDEVKINFNNERGFFK